MSIRLSDDLPEGEGTAFVTAVPGAKFHVLGRRDPKTGELCSTLYDYFDLWSWDGTLDLIHHELYVKCREAVAKEASPTAAVIDSQSVKSAEKGGPRLIRRVTTRERRSRARSGIFSSTRKAC